MKKSTNGFTIIELIIVITIISILTALGAYAFNRVQATARDSDRSTKTTAITEALEKYYNQNGEYPSCATMTQSPTIIVSDILKGLKPEVFTTPKASSGTNSIICTDISGPGDDVFAYIINSNSKIELKYRSEITGGVISLASRHMIPCPSGFIVVPGSSTYNTSDFCVMKYEAKNNGSNVAVSTATGAPWSNIAQELAGNNNDAKEYSQTACSGCHLITEAEWLTIVQNVLKVPSNWSSGVVGTGYIYSGHNDGTPHNALEADPNGDNGYYNTGNVTPSNQRRTLTLSNGQVIWDLAGNLWEWTSGTATIGKPGITGDNYDSREWPNVTNLGSIVPNIFPSATGITGASSWNSSNGIGEIFSNADDNNLRGFLRGGSFSDSIYAGIMTMDFYYTPDSSDTYFTFRVAR